MAFLIALALYIDGVSGLIRRTGPRVFASGVLGLALLMALVGIIQKASFTGKIYGFWEPISVSVSPFGPFVNKNHFAGWMVMALALSLGWFAGAGGPGRQEG